MKIKLLDSVSDIEAKVNKALSEEINKVISSKKNILLNKCKMLVSSWISSQPEMISIQNGELAGNFGIYPGQGMNALGSIVSAVENSVSVEFKRFTPKLVGGLEVNFQPSNFLGLINLPQGIVNYENGSLKWLDWLLTQGDKIIVANYQYNPKTGIGRSGLGNMIPGGSFRVPPQYSGTTDNNFITRALVGPSQEKQIMAIFKEVLGG